MLPENSGVSVRRLPLLTAFCDLQLAVEVAEVGEHLPAIGDAAQRAERDTPFTSWPSSWL